MSCMCYLSPLTSIVYYEALTYVFYIIFMTVLILHELYSNLVSFVQLEYFQLLSSWGLLTQTPALCLYLKPLSKYPACTAYIFYMLALEQSRQLHSVYMHSHNLCHSTETVPLCSTQFS